MVFRHRFIRNDAIIIIHCIHLSSQTSISPDVLSERQSGASASSDSDLMVKDVLDADPAQTFPPVTKSRRKRGYERNASEPGEMAA